MTATPGTRYRRAGLGALATLLAALFTASMLQPQAAAQTGGDEPSPGEAFAAREFGVFMHYGLATFVGTTPWNYDPHDIEPTVYDPTDFDPDQWMRAIKAAGAKYIILTTKHHDGFTMWPSAYTDYGVHNSSDPDTDVVGEVVASAREHGLEVALYYSWWDKMEPGGNVLSGAPPTPEYIQYAKNQIAELLTEYGDIVGLWLDIPSQLDLQDMAAYIHGISPDTAFIPNLTRDDPAADIRSFEGPGIEMIPCGYNAMPAEQAYNMAAGPGWWEMSADAEPRGDVDEATSVLSFTRSLGATLSLNISPGPSGQFSPAAVQLLEGIGDRVRGDNLLADGETSASGGTDQHPATNATDVLSKTYWEVPTTSDSAWVQVDLPQPMTVNTTAIQLTSEDTVSGYQIQYQASDGSWQTAHTGGSAQFPTQTDTFDAVTSSSFRLVVDEAVAGAGVVEFKAYGGLDDTADTVIYDGMWQALAAHQDRMAASVPWAGAFNDTIHRSHRPGSAATFSFTGSGVQLHTSAGPDQGSAVVRVDGGDPTFIDLYSADSQRDVVTFEDDELAYGEHTITIEPTGGHNGESRGSWVSVDRVTPLDPLAPFVPGEPFEVLPDGRLIYDDTGDRCTANSPIEYFGPWQHGGWSGAHNATRHFAFQAGAAAELTFDGTGVAVMTQTRPGHGIAAISIDGGEPELADTYSDPPEEQVIVWEKTGLPPGEHTIRIEVTGDKNPASANTWIGLDAIIVTP